MIIKGVPGNQRVFKQIGNIPNAFRTGIKRGNFYIGKDITKEAQRTINEDPKTGRVYLLRDLFRRATRIHQASRVGESPARFSGSLAASIGYTPSSSELVIGAGATGANVDIIKNTTSVIPGQIGFGRIVDYARDLELRMGRPYLITSINKKQKNTENYYYQEITRALKQVVLRRTK